MTLTVSHPSAEELYEKLRNISVDNPACTYTYERCLRLTPLIKRIQELKAEKNALILAHVYVHPDIVFGVADFVGDSYGLSKKALAASEEIIVFPSVRFMAETAKLLSPEKTVIDPNPNGGCSLADSVTAEDVYRLREKYPDHTFVCYINTTAAVKAACDVCVTSSNIYRILENLPTDKIYFVPDRLMGENARNFLKKKGIDKEILIYPGTCYVHEQIEPETVDFIRQNHPDVVVLAHPECKPEVVAKANVVGSTTQMHQYVLEHQDEKNPFLLLSECGVASRLAVEAPKARLIGGCTMCKYMRSNSLDSISKALSDPLPSQIVEIDSAIQKRARECIERMFIYAEI
ncbi:MAG TPA: quinolinate synthase NadA [Chlamydiales bacterium]|nr:quinolinate synthase NadA [Chlamydiales bacterium]